MAPAAGNQVPEQRIEYHRDGQQRQERAGRPPCALQDDQDQGDAEDEIVKLGDNAEVIGYRFLID